MPSARPRRRRSTGCGSRAARLPAHLGQGRRPARRPDGQFRSRPSQYRRRPRGHAGSAAHRRRHRQRRHQARAGAGRSDRETQKQRRHLSSHRPGFARRRAFASGSRRGAGEDSRRRRRADAGSRVHRRPRYAAAIGRRRHQAPASRRCRNRLRSPPCAAATTPWIATSAGSASQKPTTPSSKPTGRAFPMRRPSSPTPTPTRNSTSSSCRRWSATIAA